MAESNFIGTETPMLICFCIDRSGSMAEKQPNGETAISNVSACLKELVADCKKDDDIRPNASICVITFNDQAEVAVDWRKIMEVEDKDLEFEARGRTNFSAGLNLAIDKIKEEGDRLEDGMDLQIAIPLLITLTDGYGGDVKKVAKKLRERVNAGKLLDGLLCVKGYDIPTARAVGHPDRTFELVDNSLRKESFKAFFNCIKTMLKEMSKNPGEIPDFNISSDEASAIKKPDWLA